MRLAGQFVLLLASCITAAAESPQELEECSASSSSGSRQTNSFDERTFLFRPGLKFPNPHEVPGRQAQASGVIEYFARSTNPSFVVFPDHEADQLKMVTQSDDDGFAMSIRSCDGDCAGKMKQVEEEVGIPEDQRGRPLAKPKEEAATTKQRHMEVNPQPVCYVKLQGDCKVIVDDSGGGIDSRKGAKIAAGGSSVGYSTLPELHVYYQGSIRLFYNCTAGSEERRAYGRIFDHWSSWEDERSHDCGSSVENFGSHYDWGCG